MTELISAVESAAQWAHMKRSWAISAKRFEAFTVIVGGGSIVVLLVVFFHSEAWKNILENIVFPLIMAITTIACIGVLGAISLFYRVQSR